MSSKSGGKEKKSGFGSLLTLKANTAEIPEPTPAEPVTENEPVGELQATDITEQTKLQNAITYTFWYNGTKGPLEVGWAQVFAVSWKNFQGALHWGLGEAFATLLPEIILTACNRINKKYRISKFSAFPVVESVDVIHTLRDCGFEEEGRLRGEVRDEETDEFKDVVVLAKFFDDKNRNNTYNSNGDS